MRRFVNQVHVVFVTFVVFLWEYVVYQLVCVVTFENYLKNISLYSIWRSTRIIFTHIKLRHLVSWRMPELIIMYDNLTIIIKFFPTFQMPDHFNLLQNNLTNGSSLVLIHKTCH